MIHGSQMDLPSAVNYETANSLIGKAVFWRTPFDKIALSIITRRARKKMSRYNCLIAWLRRETAIERLRESKLRTER